MQAHAEAERDAGVRTGERDCTFLPHLFYEFIASLLFPLDHFSGLPLHEGSHYLFELLEVRVRSVLFITVNVCLGCAKFIGGAQKIP